MTSSLGILVRKEFSELRRDRRVLFLTLVLPVLLYPAVIGGMNRMESQRSEELRAQPLTVAIDGGAEELKLVLADDPSLQFVSLPRSEFGAAVEAAEISAGVGLPEQLSARGAASPDTVLIVGQLTRENGREARRRIEAGLRTWVAGERQSRWEEAGGRGRPEDLLAFVPRDVSTAEEATGAEAGKMIVYLLLMTLFMAASAFATDMVAGEKERGTLETLMLAPVDRRVIARSKLLVVSCGSTITGVLSLLSLGLSYRLGWIAVDGAQSVVLEGSTLFAVALLAIPLAILLGAILLAVSAWARSLKEAQYYVLPVMLLVFVPALLSMNQSIELSSFIAILPVANVAFFMRDVLAQRIDWPMLILVIGSTVLWITLLVRWVSQLLSREETLLGFDPEPFFAKTPGGRSRALNLGMLLTIVGYFYFGQWLQNKSLVVGLALSLWLLLPGMGAGVAAMVRPVNRDWSRILGLRGASPQSVIGGGLIGVGMILPIAGGLQPLMAELLPMPEADAARMGEAFANFSMTQAILLAALSPALMEEFVFRGIFLGLFREDGSKQRAVLLSALGFALIHLSIHRLAPTFVLGVLLGALVVRHGSLLPAVVMHFVYNGVLLVGGQYYMDHWAASGAPIDLDGPIMWGATTVVLWTGAWLAGLTGPLRPPAEPVS
jgi:sodium transport system permease protein